ncbi:MAG: hypothetical protein ABL962_05680 [Fimbriimonadaceae bacterium]
MQQHSRSLAWMLPTLAIAVALGLAWFWEPDAVRGIWRVAVRLAALAVGLAFIAKCLWDVFAAITGRVEPSGGSDPNSARERVSAAILGLVAGSFGLACAWWAVFGAG